MKFEKIILSMALIVFSFMPVLAQQSSNEDLNLIEGSTDIKQLQQDGWFFFRDGISVVHARIYDVSSETTIQTIWDEAKIVLGNPRNFDLYYNAQKLDKSKTLGYYSIGTTGIYFDVKNKYY